MWKNWRLVKTFSFFFKVMIENVTFLVLELKMLPAELNLLVFTCLSQHFITTWKQHLEGIMNHRSSTWVAFPRAKLPSSFCHPMVLPVKVLFKLEKMWRTFPTWTWMHRGLQLWRWNITFLKKILYAQWCVKLYSRMLWIAVYCPLKELIILQQFFKLTLLSCNGNTLNPIRTLWKMVLAELCCKGCFLSKL